MFNNSYKHLYTHTNILFSNIIIIGLSYTRKLADCILWFIHIIFSVFNFGVNLLSRAVVSIISRSSLLFVYNFNYSTDDIWQRYARTHIAPAFIVTDKSPRHRMLCPRLMTAANCYDPTLDIPWVPRLRLRCSPAPAANHSPGLVELTNDRPPPCQH